MPGRQVVALMARPTKCTPERVGVIADLVRDGVPLRHAAIAAGIAESTLHSWMVRGAKSRTGVYVEFMEAVHRAQAESVAALVAKVTKAASNDWRAAAWLLTRRAPEDFVDPARRSELVAGDAKARVIVAESRDRLEYLETRRQLKQELDDDGRED